MNSDPELSAIAAYILDMFRAEEMLIATAESCTGGLVSAARTSVAGSSDVFERGFVTYSNDAKCQMLGVDADLIEANGAVSSDVAIAMAAGALEHSNADAAVAVTGIAGPGGGTEEKPVGLVYVAVAGPQGIFVEELRLDDNDREQIRNETARQALEMLAAFDTEAGFADHGDHDGEMLN